MQKHGKEYKIKAQILQERNEWKMNFYSKKTRKIIAVVVLIVIIAMVVTMILPYLL